jgi:hypothetical protein
MHYVLGKDTTTFNNKTELDMEKICLIMRIPYEGISIIGNGMHFLDQLDSFPIKAPMKTKERIHHTALPPLQILPVLVGLNHN